MSLEQLANTFSQLATNSFSTLINSFNALVFVPITIGEVDAPFVVIWLLTGGIFFTLYLKFLNIRGVKHAIDLVRGKYRKKGDPGDISQFHALCTAISATVGIGNIAGVAFAISIGGLGAIFWMMVVGFLGMSTKCVECALGVKYREYAQDGTVRGGPMYYLKNGFAEKGFAKIGLVLGGVYAVGILIGSIGVSSLFQANQVYEQLNVAFHGNLHNYDWLVGLLLAGLVAIVIIGGIQIISKVAGKLVPFMVILYCFFAIVFITLNHEHIPQTIRTILHQAFTGEGVSGGVIGALVVGVQRAVFSGEAGIGSAAIAHAAATTKRPASEGFVGLLEPFIDTVIICTITALVIGTTMTANPNLLTNLEGVAMTSGAFSSQLPWFPPILTVVVILFAYTTMLTWAYYGQLGWSYLFGERSVIIYRIIYCGAIVIGCMIHAMTILKLADAAVFFICFVNLTGLYLLAPTIKREINHYFTDIKSKI